jgi:hypothetical protein
MSSPGVHIKVLGGAGVSAVAVAEIAQVQTRERISRQVIVLDRMVDSVFRILELVVGFADGLVFGAGESCRLVIFRLDT